MASITGEKDGVSLTSRIAVVSKDDLPATGSEIAIGATVVRLPMEVLIVPMVVAVATSGGLDVDGLEIGKEKVTIVGQNRSVVVPLSALVVEESLTLGQNSQRDEERAISCLASRTSPTPYGLAIAAEAGLIGRNDVQIITGLFRQEENFAKHLALVILGPNYVVSVCSRRNRSREVKNAVEVSGPISTGGRRAMVLTAIEVQGPVNLVVNGLFIKNGESKRAGPVAGRVRAGPALVKRMSKKE